MAGGTLNSNNQLSPINKNPKLRISGLTPGPGVLEKISSTDDSTSAALMR